MAKISRTYMHTCMTIYVKSHCVPMYKGMRVSTENASLAMRGVQLILICEGNMQPGMWPLDFLTVISGFATFSCLVAENG